MSSMFPLRIRDSVPFNSYFFLGRVPPIGKKRPGIIKTGSAVCFFNNSVEGFCPMCVAHCQRWEVHKLESGLVLVLDGTYWKVCLGSFEESDSLQEPVSLSESRLWKREVYIDPADVDRTLHFLHIPFSSSSWGPTCGGWKWEGNIKARGACGGILRGGSKTGLEPPSDLWR